MSLCLTTLLGLFLLQNNVCSILYKQLSLKSSTGICSTYASIVSVFFFPFFFFHLPAVLSHVHSSDLSPSPQPYTAQLEIQDPGSWIRNSKLFTDSAHSRLPDSTQESFREITDWVHEHRALFVESDLRSPPSRHLYISYIT